MSTWRKVPGYAAEASDAGALRAEGGERPIGQSANPSGYLNAWVKTDAGVLVKRGVARLVCAAFHGAPGAGEHVDHIDQARQNNTPDNLRWLTPAANRALRAMPSGAAHWRAKLDDVAVAAIRVSDESDRVLAERFGVHRRTVHGVRTGREWKGAANNPARVAA